LTSKNVDARSAPIVCVLSNARSGSTALRRALAVGGGLKDFGEVFHDDRTLTSLPFLDFLERWRSPLMAVLDWSECSEISRAYVQQLRFASYGQQPLIDIKHNAWGLLRPLWQFPHDEPVFLSALKDRRSVFILLKRRNLADQVISYVIAMKTHVWHARLTTSDVPDSLAGKRLEPRLARRLCELFTDAEALTEKFLSGYARHLTLTYEDIFSDGVLSDDAAHRLSVAIGIVIRPVAISLQQNTINKRDIVSNYDEVCEIAASVRAARGLGAGRVTRGDA
jgi:LPS sulfotransferase NodH